MANEYKKFVPHGVTFENVFGEKKHTWIDWKIVPTSRPVIFPPDVKKSEQDIPGHDGPLDLSESLDGEIHYNNRTGTLEFYVANRDSWVDVYSSIQNYLHGRNMKVILDDDPDYYYKGRMAVNSWKSDQSHSTIVVQYNLQSYKLKHELTTAIAKVDGEAVVICQNERMSIVPAITATTDFAIEFEGNSYAISAGENIIVPDIKFVAGDNILKCSGTGTITFTYQEGSL